MPYNKLDKNILALDHGLIFFSVAIPLVSMKKMFSQVWVIQLITCIDLRDIFEAPKFRKKEFQRKEY